MSNLYAYPAVDLYDQELKPLGPFDTMDEVMDGIAAEVDSYIESEDCLKRGELRNHCMPYQIVRHVRTVQPILKVKVKKSFQFQDL